MSSDNDLLNHRETSEGPLRTEMETEHLQGEPARFTYETELRSLIEEADSLLQELEEPCKKTPKKNLSKQCGEPRERLRQSQESFSAEPQDEETKSNPLQGEPGSFRDVQVYETELSSLTEEVDSILEEFEEPRKNLLKQNEEPQQPFGQSQESFANELQSERAKNKHLHEELEEVKVSYSEERLMYETELRSVNQQVDTLRRELDRLRKKELAEPHSFWKRLRHFVSFRKPQGWKKNKSDPTVHKPQDEHANS